MAPRRVPIRGERGRWVAQVGGQWLPVIHASLRAGTRYRDPHIGAARHSARYRELLEAFRSQGRVVPQRDRPCSFDRDGYVGVFDFTNFAVAEDGGISLDLVARWADPL